MTSTIAPRRWTVIGSGWPIASANSSRCRLCASATGRRPASSTRSPAFSPDRSAGEPGTMSTIRSPRRRPVRSASGGRQRRGRADQPQVGAAHPAVGHQRPDDPAARVVDRHGEPEAPARDRGVDADDAGRGVGQRAAGVARVERGVGLDDVLDHPRRPPVAGGQRPAEPADHARRSPSRSAPAGCRRRRPAGRPGACRRRRGSRAAGSPSARGRPPGPTAGRRRRRRRRPPCRR